MHFKYKYTDRLKVKGEKKYIIQTSITKKAEKTILILK